MRKNNYIVNLVPMKPETQDKFFKFIEKLVREERERVVAEQENKGVDIQKC